MRCKDFDAHIDEMLSGILDPDANQHMRECERCTSHFRSRAAVQDGLCQLAATALPGPSRATDRAVMDGFRRLQQRRTALPAKAQPAARLLSFPVGGAAPAKSLHPWLTHSAAAALVFAVLGSGVYLWNGVSTVNAPTSPTIATQTPATQQPTSADSPARSTVAATAVARRPSPRNAQPSSSATASQQDASLVLTAAPSEAAVDAPVLTAEGVNPSSTQPAPANAAPVMHLAGAAGNMAQSASSTWPGYSNLMYCDPVVCSGPMQVVHIKVPVGQVKPNLGQSSGNGFVNADVVVGPDGVARAIRVAN